MFPKTNHSASAPSGHWRTEGGSIMSSNGSHNGHLSASSLRARLRHPVIDADGHWLEFGPIVREQLRKIGGGGAVEGVSLFPGQISKELATSVALPRAHPIPQPALWALPPKKTRAPAPAPYPRFLTDG